jgi:hypothetical protein
MSDLTAAAPQAPCSSDTPRNEKSHLAVAFFCYLAERVGFEPTVRSRFGRLASLREAALYRQLGESCK